MRCTMTWPAVLAAWLIVASASAAGDYHGENPYEPSRDLYRPDLLVVGGSSSGTAAALTAGRLGVDTVWTLRAPRDMGGLSTNAINPDSDLPIRYIGGLALEYDVAARYTTGYHVTGKGRGEGWFAPFHVFFNYTREQVDAQASLTVLANLVPVEVQREPGTNRVSRVVFLHRLQPDRRVVVEPKITIDAEIEGDVAFLAGVEMTLCREGKQPGDDPTRDGESYAGRIFTPEKPVWSLLVAGGPPLEASTFEPDREPATMAWNGSVSVQDYGEGTAESPWVLAVEPPGYDPKEFDWWNKGTYGVLLGDNHRRWNIDHYLSTVEGWRLPDGRHVLESMDHRDREANEKAHLAHVLRGLWHLQHTRKEYRYGLSKYDFREGLPAKYSLSDFGTRTNAGDAPLPGLIYMREGRRMKNDHVFGGKLIEDDGSGRFVQKRYWHPRAAYFNAMLIDIHGVHLERTPGGGPEGMQLLRLAGYCNFGVPCIPFDVFVPRTGEATGLLVSSAGAYTHEAYAAFPRMETGRIAQGHACAVAAWHALQEDIPVHEVDVRKVQITNLQQNGQSIVYFDDTIPGTHWQLVDQMLGARRVPERNDQGVFQQEEHLTTPEARTYLQRLFRDYAEEPAPPERLAAALVELGEEAEKPAVRGAMIAALSKAAGIDAGDGPPAEPPYADVPADSPLAEQLSGWIDGGWIAADAEHDFRPEEPMPFSEFKRHAYHVLFGEVAPETVRPVDYRPWLAHDTFNRPDGPVERLASGQPVSGTGTWRVEGGQLRGTPPGTTYLLVDAGRPDVDVSLDVFLEQSKELAAAGIVVRAQDERNMQRFLLDTDGPLVRIRVDTLVDGERTDEVIQPIQTHRRGFTLRLVARGPKLAYYLDGRLVHEEERDRFAEATQVGVLSGGARPSLLDNFEVRTAD